MLRETRDRVVRVVVERRGAITDSPCRRRIWRDLPAVLIEAQIIDLVLIPAPEVKEMEVVVLLVDASPVLTGERVRE